MRDCYHERDSVIGDFEERDSGNNHLNEPRTGMSVDEFYEEIDLLSSRKAPGKQSHSIQETVGLFSDTL